MNRLPTEMQSKFLLHLRHFVTNLHQPRYIQLRMDGLCFRGYRKSGQKRQSYKFSSERTWLNRNNSIGTTYKTTCNQDVQKRVDLFDETFVDHLRSRLIHFANGIQVAKEVDNSLLNFPEKSKTPFF